MGLYAVELIGTGEGCGEVGFRVPHLFRKRSESEAIRTRHMLSGIQHSEHLIRIQTEVLNLTWVVNVLNPTWEARISYIYILRSRFLRAPLDYFSRSPWSKPQRSHG